MREMTYPRGTHACLRLLTHVQRLQRPPRRPSGRPRQLPRSRRPPQPPPRPRHLRRWYHLLSAAASLIVIAVDTFAPDECSRCTPTRCSHLPTSIPSPMVGTIVGTKAGQPPDMSALRYDMMVGASVASRAHLSMRCPLVGRPLHRSPPYCSSTSPSHPLLCLSNWRIRRADTWRAPPPISMPRRL